MHENQLKCMHTRALENIHAHIFNYLSRKYMCAFTNYSVFIATIQKLNIAILAMCKVFCHIHIAGDTCATTLVSLSIMSVTLLQLQFSQLMIAKINWRTCANFAITCYS